MRYLLLINLHPRHLVDLVCLDIICHTLSPIPLCGKFYWLHHWLLLPLVLLLTFISRCRLVSLPSLLLMVSTADRAIEPRLKCIFDNSMSACVHVRLVGY